MNSPIYLPVRQTIAAPTFYPSVAFFGLAAALFCDLAAGGIAPELVGSVLISFMSLLAQGVADVYWPNGKRSPSGVSTYIVANSGFGKSLMQLLLMEVIQEVLLEIEVPSDGEKTPNFFIEDATREALVESLAEWPCAALFTDEADMIRKLFIDAATLAKLTDGSPLNHARISTGRVRLHGHRFCICVSEQLDKFMEKKDRIGAKTGGVGLPNRMLMTYVATSAIYGRAKLHDTKISATVRDAFREIVRSRLMTTVSRVRQLPNERPLIRPDRHAAEFLIEMDDVAGALSAPGAHYDRISEYVIRHAERTLRLAAAMHIFEYGDEGEIPLDTMQRAHTIGKYHIENYAHLMYEPPKLSRAEEDAQVLESLLHSYVNTYGCTQFPKKPLSDFVVNVGLTPARFTRALAVLGGQRKVRVYTQNRQSWVELNTFQPPLYR